MLPLEPAHSLPLKILNQMLISKSVTYVKAHLDSSAIIDYYREQKEGADPLDHCRGGTLWYGVFYYLDFIRKCIRSLKLWFCSEQWQSVGSVSVTLLTLIRQEPWVLNKLKSLSDSPRSRSNKNGLKEQAATSQGFVSACFHGHNQVVRNAFVSASQCSLWTPTFWCHMAFLNTVCVSFWITFHHTRQVTDREKNMNASCPRVNRTHIWRTLGNLGEGSDCLQQGSGLPKDAQLSCWNTHAWTDTFKWLNSNSEIQCSSSCCHITYQTQVLELPVLEICVSPYKRETESVAKSRSIHFLSLSVCVSTWPGPLYHLQGSFL